MFTILTVRANGTYEARLMGDPDDEGPASDEERLEWAAWLRPGIAFARGRGGGAVYVAWPESP